MVTARTQSSGDEAVEPKGAWPQEQAGKAARRLSFLFAKVSLPFFLAAAWWQVLSSLFELIVPEESLSEEGQLAKAAYIAAYASVVYAFACGGVALLHQIHRVPAEIFLGFVGHLVGFAFRDTAIAVLEAFVPCQNTYIYTVLNFVVSPLVMALLGAVRLLLRVPDHLEDAIADLDTDGFGFLCGWSLNNSFHALLAVASGGDSQAPVHVAWWPYTILVGFVATKLAVFHESIRPQNIKNRYARHVVQSWLDLSFKGWSLTLGWTISATLNQLANWITAAVGSLLLQLLIGAIVVSILGMFFLSLNLGRVSKHAQSGRHGCLEDLVRAEEDTVWPPLVDDWDKRPQRVKVKEAAVILSQQGSFLVCNTTNFFVVRRTVLVEHVREGNEQSRWRRLMKLVSLTGLSRKIAYLWQPHTLMEKLLMRDREGRWVLTRAMYGFKRASIRKIAWGLVIGWRWEEFFTALISWAALDGEEEEPRFFYCSSSAIEAEGEGGGAEVSAEAPGAEIGKDGGAGAPGVEQDEGGAGEADEGPGGRMRRRAMLAEEGMEDSAAGGGSLLRALLVHLSFAVASTVVFGGLLWWIARVEASEGIEGDESKRGERHDEAEEPPSLGSTKENEDANRCSGASSGTKEPEGQPGNGLCKGGRGREVDNKC